MESPETYETWAIVEVMGHSMYAGFVSEQKVAGGVLVRVDVPQTSYREAFTKLLGTQSIFCITPCDETLARRAAEQLAGRTQPIPVYLPPERQLTATTGAEVLVGVEDDDEDEDALAPF